MVNPSLIAYSFAAKVRKAPIRAIIAAIRHTKFSISPNQYETSKIVPKSVVWIFNRGINIPKNISSMKNKPKAAALIPRRLDIFLHQT